MRFLNNNITLNTVLCARFGRGLVELDNAATNNTFLWMGLPPFRPPLADPFYPSGEFPIPPLSLCLAFAFVILLCCLSEIQ